MSDLNVYLEKRGITAEQMEDARKNRGERREWLYYRFGLSCEL